MADNLYLSLWFPTFDAEEILPKMVAVMRQLTFSAVEPGVTYVAVQPLNWSEASVLERRFTPPAGPEEAAEAVAEFAHEDFAISFEAYWDLWMPDERGAEWHKHPEKVAFIAHGKRFDEGIYTDSGHIEIDFGLDFPFLYEEMELAEDDEDRVRWNVAKLIDFTQKIEKNVNLTGSVLWSESEDNLAQKLIARLQRVQ